MGTFLTLVPWATWATWAESLSSTSTFGVDFASYPFLKWEARDLSQPSLNFHWQGEQQGSLFEVGSHVGLQMTYHPAGESAFFFEFPEAYVGTSKSLSAAQLTFGRRLQHWSGLDETWKLGIWQPRFRWDDVRPEEVGLLGAFFSVDLPFLQFVVLGSPAFIPERGVPVSLENGTVVSRSPWLLPPPSQVRVLDEITAVEYSLSLPNTADVVKHAGLDIMLRLGEETGPWISASYAYKPMNQLLLAFDGYLQLNGQGGPEVAQATIYPRILYHHLNALEAGYRGASFQASISALSERPERDITSPDWTTQEVEPAVAVSPTVTFVLGGTSREPSRLDLSYLHVWGGNAADGSGKAGGFTGSGGSVFEPRYPFEQAARVGLRTGLGGLGLKNTDFLTQVLEDLKNRGTIFSLELKIRPLRSWEMAFGADILGVMSSQTDTSYSYIGRYQSNDRFHAGVTYVF